MYVSRILTTSEEQLNCKTTSSRSIICFIFVSNIDLSELNILIEDDVYYVSFSFNGVSRVLGTNANSSGK